MKDKLLPTQYPINDWQELSSLDQAVAWANDGNPGMTVHSLQAHRNDLSDQRIYPQTLANVLVVRSVGKMAENNSMPRSDIQSRHWPTEQRLRTAAVTLADFATKGVDLTDPDFNPTLTRIINGL